MLSGVNSMKQKTLKRLLSHLSSSRVHKGLGLEGPGFGLDLQGRGRVFFRIWNMGVSTNPWGPFPSPLPFPFPLPLPLLSP